MNELVKIQNNNGQKLVNARELHSFLESKQQFSDWIKNRIEKYGFELDKDYSVHKFMNAFKVEVVEYFLTLDTAKEISMVENNEKGKQARRYFIECEKVSLQKQLPKNFSEALRLAADLEEQNQLLLPKAQVYDMFIDAVSSKSFGTVAKEIDPTGKILGQNRLFSLLKNKGILMMNRIPYQTYMNLGYFIVKEIPQDRGDINVNYSKTFFTPKGQEWLIKRLKEWEVI